MAQVVIMPRQGISVESCIISEWKKNEGDSVVAGDILFTYETDKAAFEEEASTDGIMLRRLYDEGDEVPCLQTVCIIGQEGEDISDLLPDDEDNADQAAPAVKKVADEAEEETIPPSAAPSVSENGTMKISPRARNLAERSHADLHQAQGSGPEGRIIERDVVDLIKRGKKVNAEAPGVSSRHDGVFDPAACENDYTEEPLSNLRKIVGKAMHESLSTMAQLTLNASFDATQIMEFRKAVKASGEGLGMANITINDIILFSVSRTLLKHPDINAHYMGDHIRRFTNANIGIATDTPRGLLVPTLFGADSMGLDELSIAAKRLIEDARSGQISPDLLTGGTFTVTNLGVLGVESFTPVINPPQTAILGVCTIRTELKSDGTPYPAMGLSLTFDHRAMDGAPAARFLQDLCGFLETFHFSLAVESSCSDNNSTIGKESHRGI